MWKRGTELPWPSARPSPRSAQPTIGKVRWPISRSQERFSPAAKSTYASAQRRGQRSSVAVELGAAQPVLHRQLAGVLDAHPALLGAVHEEQPAEAPERLPAERLLALLVEQQHPLPGVGHLGGSGQSGQAGAHDDHIGVHVRDPRTRAPRPFRTDACLDQFPDIRANTSHTRHTRPTRCDLEASPAARRHQMGSEIVQRTRPALAVLIVGSAAVESTVAAVVEAAGGNLLPTRAESPLAALAALASSRFDCVITEIDALDPSAVESVRALRDGAGTAAVVVVCDDGPRRATPVSRSSPTWSCDQQSWPPAACDCSTKPRTPPGCSRGCGRPRPPRPAPPSARTHDEYGGLEAELVRHTMHDGLTGLPNRTYLTYRLVRELAEARLSRDPVAVLVTDLDQFRAVDDLHGALVGDRVLVEVAERLRSLARPTDIVARTGGDEFVLVCPGTGEAAAARLAGQMIEAVGLPVELEHRTVRVGVSVGIAVSSPSSGGAAKLLKQADLALYEAKTRGGSQAQVFDASVAERSRDLLHLTEDLRTAIADGTLDVCYQPIVDVARGGLAGHEALARWSHPVRGEVSPDLFVRIAEQGGFVTELDRWVLARSCRDVRTALDAGNLGPGTRISVNLSARSLADPALIGWVRELLAAEGLPPQIARPRDHRDRARAGRRDRRPRPRRPARARHRRRPRRLRHRVLLADPAARAAGDPGEDRPDLRRQPRCGAPRRPAHHRVRHRPRSPARAGDCGRGRGDTGPAGDPAPPRLRLRPGTPLERCATRRPARHPPRSAYRGRRPPPPSPSPRAAAARGRLDRELTAAGQGLRPVPCSPPPSPPTPERRRRASRGTARDPLPRRP